MDATPLFNLFSISLPVEKENNTMYLPDQFHGIFSRPLPTSLTSDRRQHIQSGTTCTASHSNFP